MEKQLADDENAAFHAFCLVESFHSDPSKIRSALSGFPSALLATHVGKLLVLKHKLPPRLFLPELLLSRLYYLADHVALNSPTPLTHEEWEFIFIKTAQSLQEIHDPKDDMSPLLWFRLSNIFPHEVFGQLLLRHLPPFQAAEVARLWNYEETMKKLRKTGPSSQPARQGYFPQQALPPQGVFTPDPSMVSMVSFNVGPPTPWVGAVQDPGFALGLPQPAAPRAQQQAFQFGPPHDH